MRRTFSLPPVPNKSPPCYLGGPRTQAFSMCGGQPVRHKRRHRQVMLHPPSAFTSNFKTSASCTHQPLPPAHRVCLASPTLYLPRAASIAQRRCWHTRCILLPRRRVHQHPALPALPLLSPASNVFPSPSPPTRPAQHSLRLSLYFFLLNTFFLQKKICPPPTHSPLQVA